MDIFNGLHDILRTLLESPNSKDLALFLVVLFLLLVGLRGLRLIVNSNQRCNDRMVAAIDGNSQAVSRVGRRMSALSIQVKNDVAGLGGRVDKVEERLDDHLGDAHGKEGNR